MTSSPAVARRCPILGLEAQQQLLQRFADAEGIDLVDAWSR